LDLPVLVILDVLVSPLRVVTPTTLGSSSTIDKGACSTRARVAVEAAYGCELPLACGRGAVPESAAAGAAAVDPRLALPAVPALLDPPAPTRAAVVVVDEPRVEGRDGRETPAREGLAPVVAAAATTIEDGSGLLNGPVRVVGEGNVAAEAGRLGGGIGIGDGRGGAMGIDAPMNEGKLAWYCR